MKENAYFDNASTSWPKPEAAYSFIDQFQRSHGVNPSRGGNAMAEEAETMVMQTRQMLIAFFGFSGPASRVVFTANITDSINRALVGLLRPGDHLLTTRIEHNAVLRTANYLERDGGISVSRVPANASGMETAYYLNPIFSQRWFNALGAKVASPYGLTSSKEALSLKVPLSDEDREYPVNAEAHAQRCKDAIRHVHTTEMNHIKTILSALQEFKHVDLAGIPPTKKCSLAFRSYRYAHHSPLLTTWLRTQKQGKIELLFLSAFWLIFCCTTQRFIGHVFITID